MSRIKGQEIILSFTNPDGPQEELGDMKSAEAVMELEILREGYLGKKNDDYDEILHGFTGNMEFHLKSPAYFKFQQLVQDRAQRRTPAAGKFSLTGRFEFPSGESFRLVFENLVFGSMPVTMGAREQYIAGKIDWATGTCRRLF